MLFLLQVAEDKISLLSLLQKGGWIMYPLYFLLVIAIFVFIERVLAIKKAGTMDPKLCLLLRTIFYLEILMLQKLWLRMQAIR